MKPIEIKEVRAAERKSEICSDILRTLPDWFGIEQALADYVKESADMLFYAAFDGEKPIGFAAIKEHNVHTAEVYVMGIVADYHRLGIGRRLISCCEDYCVASGRQFLTVKTLDESRPDKNYAKTRRFYISVGFKPLEVFPTLWDEHNPCLFLAKHIPADHPAE